MTGSKVAIAGVPATVMVAGLKPQLAFVGRPEHANVTDPENAAPPVTLMGALTEWPAWTVRREKHPWGSGKAAGLER